MRIHAFVLFALCLALGACAGQPVVITPPSVTTADPAILVTSPSVTPVSVPTSTAGTVTVAAQTPTLTGNPISDIDQIINRFGTFTSADLDNAEAIAIAYQDPLAQGCAPAIKAWLFPPPVPGGPDLSKLTVSGAFSLYEKARVTRLKIQGQVTGGIVPVAVKKACGAVFLDEQNFWVKFAAMIGAGVASGGAAPAAGGILSGIGAALPIPLHQAIP